MDRKKYLLDGINKLNLGINLSDEQVNKMFDFMDIVLTENQKFNLTNITNIDEFIEKHIIDSLIVANYLKDDSYILDIGSGAGFPGIILKLAKPSVNVLLIDSLNKRIKYLNEAVEKLGLTNITAIHIRAEDLGRDENFREKFNYVTARAVDKLNVLLEYAVPLLKTQGEFICMKGKEIKEEITSSKSALKALNSSIKQIDEYTLPYSNATRNIIVIKKNEKTKNKYPRITNQIKKDPL